MACRSCGEKTPNNTPPPTKQLVHQPIVQNSPKPQSPSVQTKQVVMGGIVFTVPI